MTAPRRLSVGVRDVTFGHGVTLVEPCNLYECVIGDGCFIGPFTEIQAGVTVGARCRIQSHAFICELVTIGSDCFVSHGAKFVNDLLRSGPARGDKSKWMSTTIGDNVSVGTNATVLPVHICNDVIIGAGAVVVSDISVSGRYAGNPARRIS